jgi:site-specific DNA-methyltransferase (adenine-specific)
MALGIKCKGENKMRLKELCKEADYVDKGGCLLNKNCFDIIKKLENNSIDLVLTDPPYGISLTPQRKNGKFKDTKVINDDNLDWLSDYVEEIYRISKNVCCFFCGWQHIDKFKIALEKKFIIKNILVWNKDWFGMGNNYRPNYELIILCCKTNFTIPSKNKSNILTYRRLSPQKLTHSCEKPVSLLSDLISELSTEGNVILDTFMGTGSTIDSAKRLNRKYIGIELDENYFNIAKERISSIKIMKEFVDKE